MSPQQSAVVHQLRQQIYYHLDNDLLQNALFLAGRYHGLDPRSADAAHLLALCHLKMGQFKAAYDYSRDKALRAQHLGCAYVFAQACLGLELYADGITTLERSKGLWAARNHWNKHSHLQRQHIPDAAAVTCLLGKLSRAHLQQDKAVSYFHESLKLNPFMWDAFQELCDIGVTLHTSSIFKLTPEMLANAYSIHCLGPPSDVSQNLPLQSQGVNGQHHATPSNDPFNPTTTRTAGDPGLNHGGSNLLSRLNGSFKEAKPQSVNWETPTANSSRFDDEVMMNDIYGGHNAEAPHAPVRNRKGRTLHEDPHPEPMRAMTTRSRTKAGSETSEDVVRSSIPVTQKRTVSGHPPPGTTNVNADSAVAPARRSNRLLNSIRPSSSRGASLRDTEAKEKRELRKPKAPSIRSSRTTSTVGRVVSGNRKPPGPEERERALKESSRPASVTSMISSVQEPTARKVPPPPPADNTVEQEALQWLLDLLSKLGEGHYRLSKYQCQSAIQVYQTVSQAQRETPWVLAQIGKALYERALYDEAKEAFEKVRKLAPSRMEDMEIYSTVLWHLKDDIRLGHLSHQLLDTDRLAPEAWCTLGNSFSLQREHDQAVKCFKRATQLDPKFAYAFTLQGHELVANEEFDKALYAYRCAISADNRHYNGWYGLGQVFEKLQRYDLAEKHYRCAHEINSSNPLLALCIGFVLDKMGKQQAALIYYSQASTLDPQNAKARFMKARALMKLKHFDEARAELERLKVLAPNEATVHFMLGKLYKVMGEKSAAIQHLTNALNLDPKAAPHIKEALESLEADEDWEDDDVD